MAHASKEMSHRLESRFRNHFTASQELKKQSACEGESDDGTEWEPQMYHASLLRDFQLEREKRSSLNSVTSFFKTQHRILPPTTPFKFLQEMQSKQRNARAKFNKSACELETSEKPGFSRAEILSRSVAQSCSRQSVCKTPSVAQIC